MADPSTIIAITSISAVGIGILGKLLYTLRHNVKNCFGVVFRTPESQSRHSPRRDIELANVKNHFENTLPIKVTPTVLNNVENNTELDKQIKLRELELKLQEMGTELVYI